MREPQIAVFFVDSKVLLWYTVFIEQANRHRELDIMTKYNVEKNGLFTRYTPVAEENEVWVEQKTCWQDGTSTTDMVLMDKKYAAMIVPIPERKISVTYKGYTVILDKRETSAFDFYQPKIVKNGTEIILPFEIMKMKSGEYIAFTNIEGYYEIAYPTAIIATLKDGTMSAIVALLNK